MRVVQIIDSLDIGGAERMALNYANALSQEIEFSGLVATRREGSLLLEISQDVSYLYLNKKKSVDWSAVFRLKAFIKKNSVEIIHAHSSSFFIAVLVKLIYPKVKIVWHDHYGTRVKESKKENKTLIFCSLFFDIIITVNRQLKDWSIKNLNSKNVVFIPNFIIESSYSGETTVLNGIDGKRIVFLANLKDPKNHIAVLKAFSDLKLFESGWSLHLIGKDYFDLYSQNLKDYIKTNSLDNHVHLYGTKNDIKFILSQASIGILASTFEGFPVTLIEYGKAELAVLSTNSGFCSEIIKNRETGLSFDPLEEKELLSQLKELTDNESLRKHLAKNLKNLITRYYSKEETVKKILQEYSKI